MKQLRSAAFLSLMVFLIVLLSPSSSGQSALQQSPASSGQATSGAPTQQTDGPWRKPTTGQSVPTCDLLAIDGCVPRPGGGARLNYTTQLGDPRIDPGIRLRTGAGNVCGSIVSYNFSPGENPQLESVTTCTPADTVTTRRAWGKDKKPPAPLFRTSELSTSPQ